jgi:hypothetical protein
MIIRAIPKYLRAACPSFLIRSCSAVWYRCELFMIGELIAGSPPT